MVVPGWLVTAPEPDLPAGSTFAAAANDVAWQAALDALLADWADLSTAQREVIAEQVQAAVEAGDPAALAEIDVPTEDTAATLADALTALLLVAAALAVVEALAQGVHIPGLPALTDGQRTDWGDGQPSTEDLTILAEVFLTEPRQAWIDGYAHTTATTLGQGYGHAAAREALRVWQDPPPAATPAQTQYTAENVAKTVDDYLTGLSQAYLTDQLGGALHMALNTGRVALLDLAPKATYFASEAMDGNTCQPCKDEDGTEFGSLTEATAAYPTGGYRDCEGGLRCRGTVVALWNQPAT